MNFLEGKKTYIGIALLVLAYTRFGGVVSESELTTIVDNVIALAGLITAIYGRAVAKV